MEGHIVITGATGVIGSEVARRLIKSGRKVVLFARSPQSAQAKVPGAAGYVRWDSDMAEGEWRASVDGAYGVVHLAGRPLLETRWTEEHKVACYDSRINGTRAIVSAMAAAAVKPKVFVSSSAIGYYGSFERCDETAPLTETASPGKDFLAKICYDWEKEAQPAEKPGTRVVLLRTGIVLSTRGGMLQKLMTPFSYFIGGPVGSGDQCLSWIHIDDEVSIILEALDNPAWSGPVNAVSPDPASMKEFADMLGSVMHRPALLPVPKFAVQILMGEGADYAVKGQKVIPGFLKEHDFHFAWPLLHEALADLVSRGI
ncbi:TIGR01777 family protein [Chlorobaculum limnaeum]|uniref:TIGR01777 family protein n=1 Tax=Chlorobaculum limnaeum TaxID=274537 RepID=A0A1D8CX98_CHLLM|nr:TIGR01777 family oxidoreductase [Chlorobaculum limnaeum]AOS82721.1 TIGR01777 family protein [Chlorobaculum limnaeum]